jgi:hypothetical protein
MHKIRLSDYIHGSMNVYQNARPGTQHRWVFDHMPMTEVEFAQRVYGDSPKTTEFLLRYGTKTTHKQGC